MDHDHGTTGAVTHALAKAALTVTLSLTPLTVSADPMEVDVELVLAVDVSRSMSPAELEIQRRGYAEALVSDEVMAAISKGLLGRIAIQYVEWAGEYAQRIVVDWTVISNHAEARRVADALTAHFDSSMRRTSISGGINFAVFSLETNEFVANRRVIDVSGDGPNNQGPYVNVARDEAIAKGIVINGLPLMTKDDNYSHYHLDDLDAYYRDCVIGGPASFLLPVYSWEEFPAAVRRKLILELAGHTPQDDTPRVIPTSGFNLLDPAAGGYDCRIGEKIWEQRQWMWSEP